jgi:hypothetical protein
MLRSTRLVLLTAGFVLGTSAAAFAQASITGVVSDTSGAVLPGVTVEASSPVLIEKVRSAISDGTGQYRIVDLRPGIYTITFTLTGFNSVRREGLELTGSFTATVNAEMRVGSLEETVTVTGESPIVDVQSTLQQRVLDREVLDTIPAGRNHRLYSVLIPGIVSGVQDVGGTNALQLGSVAIHGGRQTDQRLMVDGILIRNVAAQGQVSNFIPDTSSTQEVTVDYAAGSAESMTGGVNFNYIPREGGNRFSGSVFATWANRDFQGDNYSDELRDQGLRAPNALHTVYDFNPSGGGPIRADKIWFYSAARWQANKRYTAGLWNNLNAGDATKWTYEPDYSSQAVFDLNQSSVNTRLTWQAAEKHKINLFYENQWRDYDNVGLPLSPESNQHWVFPRLRATTASWTSPITNRLLFEMRASNRAEDIRNLYPEVGDPFRYLIAVTEQFGIIPNLRYRGKGVASDTSTSTFDTITTNLWEVRSSLSYVTGAHAFKVGFANNWGAQKGDSYDVPTATTYRFANGIPNQIQQRQTEYQDLIAGVRAELGVYVQDKWTLKRLTLNLGLRYDYFNSGFEDFYLGPTTLVPTRDIFFPERTFNNYHDISPRLGAVYDLSGSGRTAFKINLSRYMLAVDPLFGNPMRDQLVNRVTRAWTDADGDFNPDCDLVNPFAQDLRPRGGDFCGQISDLRFGQAIPSQEYDPATFSGWGVRENNWEFSTSIQHELVPRVGLEAGYFRRWFNNFRVTDNRAVTSSDFGEFSLTAPSDPRLPDGGGYVLGGLYNVNPNRFGFVDNYVTLARNFGHQREHWNGMDFTINARPPNGMLLQGGVSTGRTSSDNCELRAVLPEIDPVNPFCGVEGAFLTQIKFLGTYRIPKIDLQLAATFQSLPGPNILANYVATNAEIIPSLGRPLSGSAPNVTVNIVEPGEMYGERLNQLDVRFSRMFPYRGLRTTVNLDIFNALNGNAVRTVNNNYSAWLTPTGILDARLFRISAQLDF